MTPPRSRQPRFAGRCALVFLCGAAAVGVLGCHDPEITHYSAPRDKNPSEVTRLAGYDLPPTWKRLPTPEDKITNALFRVGEGKESANVTISRGSGGGVIANVQRWRKQIGLPEAKEEEISKALRALKVDGESAYAVDLGDQTKTDARRTLGVIVECGSMTWYFKMIGPYEFVGTQQKAFDQFVNSVKFCRTGANDG